MKLVFHGGAREVGRSCVEVVTEKRRILLDCGLKLSEHGTEFPMTIEDPEGIDAVFISHAHLDHTGALPLLDHQGMDCPIFATKTTKALSHLLLKDAFKVGKITHQHIGYEVEDIRNVLGCMNRVKIDTKGDFDGLSYKYFDAGHIPGSASVYINMDGTRILYTGDINTIETRLHKPAETDFPEVDLLICESTYGDREHPVRLKEEQRFIESIEATLARGGSVIIPVFAIGRSQEIILLLAKQKFGVPVYFDGMGVAATDIILENPESVKDAKALTSAMKKVNQIRRAGDRKGVLKEKCIIVTTSGMLTGGPVIHYLKYMHTDPDNSLLITGYQGEGTNGRMLLEEGVLFLDGFRKRVKCEIKKFDFSAHAGMSELKGLVRKIKPKKVIFMHGDEAPLMNLAEWASALDMDVKVPNLGETVEVVFPKDMG
ncbi:MAG: MBL fold metallo-hydrolase [Candidatus Woesearchaeota archaeon]